MLASSCRFTCSTVESLARCCSAEAAVCDRRGGGWGRRELDCAGLWKGDGAGAGRVEDRGGPVSVANDDGAITGARRDDEPGCAGAARSGKRRALVAGRVGGKNIPSAEAGHRGARDCGVCVRHRLRES